METKKTNRWFIAIMGTILQIVLGTVYAWSFFQKPIIETFSWSNVQTMWIFSLAIVFLGLSAAWGGVNLSKFGPRKLATTGAVLYGLGYIISAFAMSIGNLPLFYIGFGIIGGIGLGLGYVTPVATAAKWFPDKKGFVTGMVVMGFGLGALFMSKVIAPVLMNITGENLVWVFAFAGIVLLIIGVVAGYSMVNPPAGFVPEGYTPVQKSAVSQGQEDSLTVKKSLLSSKFLGMWIVFFLNISAGIMFIGLQSPMLQDLLRIKDGALPTEVLAATGATLIAISSLFNGVGRFFWGALSDKIGRIQAFRLILGTQILVFIALIYIGNPWLFGIMVCYVLLCYGGGFGTMPSYVLDVFHAKLMPVVYGVILTAWSLGGIVGPQVAAFIRDFYADTPKMVGPTTYMAGAILLGLGFIVTLTLTNKSITEVKQK